ncbi:short-subunit dehydrogenase [Plasticicumulans lactativorans]|uniref:Short-subunit dehydrogenase n=1 Tax=Plasticicumulans lactativorans TaxID=1133106 RepID=A0A4R2L9I8_9GAMM|nr:SDR family oxidoreductase [Plasticicumulans lactativorans]TCO80806.1 short-subunit dehydrogenase [Plasticicumulans lactativorans]
MAELDRPVAVVTGANRGLGLATARALASHGLHVLMTSRNAEAGAAATERLAAAGLDVAFHPLEVTDAGSVATLGAFVRSRCGRIDVLVNNAGVLLDGHGLVDRNGSSAFKASLDTLRTTMETNVYGPLALAQEFVPLMRTRGYGRVVNVSSGMGQLADMGGHWPAYRISKAALNALTRILAAETAGSGILVNAISPGWVRTDMGGQNAERSPEEAAAGIVWAATLPDDGPSGGFFRDGVALPW